MKLASIDDGTVDGQLVIVSRDLKAMVPAAPVAATMQEALERWTEVVQELKERSRQLERGQARDASPFVLERALAPLPRAWQFLDGSAFESHGDLMASAFGIAKLPFDKPLMYQGMSNQFHPGRSDVPMLSEDLGIDFEGEFGVIITGVPMGATTEQAHDSIALLVLINDWSLRELAPEEMNLKFGFIQSKPASGLAPVAITPDELGTQWSGCRVGLPLHVHLNNTNFGCASGSEMAFGFDDLIVHAARTRALCAGTIIGSGTVSNVDAHLKGFSCITERRAFEMADAGTATTEYMHFGDTVTMCAEAPDGVPLFGELIQTVVRHH
ncbi:MAG: fumarylacetoacetate hydrolase family protein [Mycobacterium sp.]